MSRDFHRYCRRGRHYSAGNEPRLLPKGSPGRAATSKLEISHTQQRKPKRDYNNSSRTPTKAQPLRSESSRNSPRPSHLAPRYREALQAPQVPRPPVPLPPLSAPAAARKNPGGRPTARGGRSSRQAVGAGRPRGEPPRRPASEGVPAGPSGSPRHRCCCYCCCR